VTTNVCVRAPARIAAGGVLVPDARTNGGIVMRPCRTILVRRTPHNVHGRDTSSMAERRGNGRHGVGSPPT